MSWDSDFTVVNAFENIVEPREKPFSLYIHTLETETNAKLTDRSIFEYLGIGLQHTLVQNFYFLLTSFSA